MTPLHTAPRKPRNRRAEGISVRFQSSEMIGAPGFLRWAQAMARTNRRAALRTVKACYPGMPQWAYDAVLGTQILPEHIDEAGAVRLTLRRTA